MPRRGSDVANRNAAIILTYFHPFTLNPDMADEHVPFLGNLCQSGKTWHESLLHWFDGHVLCAETKRYLDNFLAVTRARPEDEEEAHSDDELSDEEILAAQKLLAEKEGIFCEPASAASIGGAMRDIKSGKIAEGSTVVCTLTGNGLKDPDTAIEQCKDSRMVTIDAELDAVLDAIVKNM